MFFTTSHLKLSIYKISFDLVVLFFKMQNLLFNTSNNEEKHKKHERHGGGKKKSTKKASKSTKQTVQNMISQVKFNSEGISPIEELELKYNPNNTEDLNELRYILGSKLSYPSIPMTQVHFQANRLGNFDIQRQKTQLNELFDQNTKFCVCCGFVEQKQTLTICHDLENINHIGVSTYLFFLTIKNVFIMITCLMVLFSTYALISNKVVQSNPDSRAIQLLVKQWLCVVVVIIWGVLFVFFKYQEQASEYEVDYDSITDSDFSLYFEKMPKEMTVEVLEKQLKEYQEEMKGSINNYLINEPIRVIKIVQATPFYLDQSSFEDEELKRINQDFSQCKENIINLINERKDSETFKTSKEDRTKLYQRFDDLKTRKINRLKQITEQIIIEKKEENKEQDVVPAFVTFGSNYNKQFLQMVNDRSSYKGLYVLPCFFNRRKYYHYKTSSGHEILSEIEAAPEPEDIIWTNLGQSNWEVVRKKMITFSVAIIILVISFFVNYGLSQLQTSINRKTDATERANVILSTLISLFISVFNIILSQIMFYLTKYERNETYIDEQKSLGLKAAFAGIKNSIIIPIMVNYIILNKYNEAGLVQDVFYLSITNTFLTPFLKILDTGYIIKKISQWYYNRPYSRLPLNQFELNNINELMEFSIGYQYIYVVNLLLFTSFFASMQPVITFFVMIGIFLNYFVEKYYLYNRCQRPTPGDTDINTAMYQLIYLAPLLLILGSIFSENYPVRQQRIVSLPNTVGLIIALLIFVLPFKKVLKQIVPQKLEQKMYFEESRIFLPSEYDRLNPETSQKALEEYSEYIAKYKQSLKYKTAKEIEDVAFQLNRQCGTGHRQHQGNHSHDQDNLAIQNLLGGTSANSVNPFLIGNTVLPQHMNPDIGPMAINSITQNWLTEQEIKKNQNNNNNNNQNNPFISLVNGLGNNNEGQANFQQKNNGEAQGTELQQPSLDLNLQTNLFGNLLNINQQDDNESNAWVNWEK